MSDKKLGRGFSQVSSPDDDPTADRIFDLPGAEAAPEGAIQKIAVGLIDPNPHQPRIAMKEESLKELTASIQENGVLQPILVRESGDRFELIAGERRWQAAKAAGLQTIPAVIRDVDDAKALELAIIENIQREDLNPIDRALAYQDLIERFTITQEEAAHRLSINRSTLANLVRLLELPDEVRALVSSDALSMGHAKAILATRSTDRMISLAHRIVEAGLSVRESERLSVEQKPEPKTVAPPRRREKANHIKAFEQNLKRALSTKVTITEGVKPGTGQLTVNFYSLDQFETVYNRLIDNSDNH